MFLRARAEDFDDEVADEDEGDDSEDGHEEEVDQAESDEETGDETVDIVESAATSAFSMAADAAAFAVSAAATAVAVAADIALAVSTAGGGSAGDASSAEPEAAAVLAVEYSTTMQAAMGNASLVYRHELGMNYNRVLPDLIVGSCPQSVEDVDTLRDQEAVGSILCLQQNSDLDYFGLNLDDIIFRTQERGDIQHIRAEIRDFDPFSLRLELPMAVAKMHKANRERGTVYVHCTAGLGRAPAVALAYMWWMRDFRLLEDANQVLQAVRPCGPKLFAIRAALCDLLTGNPREPVTVTWRSRGTMPKSVEVAGLDVGWHNRLALERSPGSMWWRVTRQLPVGKYFYKFIVDGDKWTYNPDVPLTQPDRDNNVNNFSDVPGSSLTPEAQALRRRLMEEETPLEAEERALVVQRINELADAL